MAHRDTPQPPEPDDTGKFSRRSFLQGSLATAAAAALALPHDRGEAATAQPSPRDPPLALSEDTRPNILIILCDQMRFPPVYESEATKQFRQNYLTFQNTLRANGLDFQRHYVMSAACVPSRASIVTGHYPSLHGASQTTGGPKEPWDPDAFWLAPRSVPTFGQYFRAAGYRTFWRGKWHVSAADMLIPGTHTSLLSYDSDGNRDPDKEDLYTKADQLGPYGFAGWIGPEPHGSSPLNSGSSVPAPQRGRDVSFAEQTVELIQELDQGPNSAPWLVVCSFTNPHDIGMYGFWADQDPSMEFKVDETVPSGDPNDDNFLFIRDQFERTFKEDDLSTKPTAQQSYRDVYRKFLQVVLDNEKYRRLYYQLHKNVDQQMMNVMDALLGSRFRDDTIVVFTSDHGELLGAHGDLHQKWHQAYDETIRVPLIIWSPKLIGSPGKVEALTSHVDLAPTLLGLAGIDPETIRQKLALNHSDAVPFVGRDLSPLILGQVDAASVNDPVYFMTDDDISRGLNMKRKVGFGLEYYPVEEPNSIETVIARLKDGHLWKYSRYFDNPQYWTSPGTPGDPDEEAQDVLRLQVEANPMPDTGPALRDFQVTVKATPKPDEKGIDFEMYNLDDDPMELQNLYGDPAYQRQEKELARLLQKQRGDKRLTPCSGTVPGQECNPWDECAAVCK